MGTIPFTTEQLIKVIDGRLYSPIQDVVGDNYTIGSPLVMTAETEYPFMVNGNLRNFKNLPSHIDNMWNTTSNIATFTDFLDTPEIVSNIQFTFDPQSANAGSLTLRVYVNETSPILMKSYTVSYKALLDRYTILATFYAGAETGFDVKNKGVYYTIESSANGSLYDPALEIYRT